MKLNDRTKRSDKHKDKDKHSDVDKPSDRDKRDKGVDHGSHDNLSNDPSASDEEPEVTEAELWYVTLKRWINKIIYSFFLILLVGWLTK